MSQATELFYCSNPESTFNTSLYDNAKQIQVVDFVSLQHGTMLCHSISYQQLLSVQVLLHAVLHITN